MRAPRTSLDAVQGRRAGCAGESLPQGRLLLVLGLSSSRSARHVGHIGAGACEGGRSRVHWLAELLLLLVLRMRSIARHGRAALVGRRLTLEGVVVVIGE